MKLFCWDDEGGWWWNMVSMSVRISWDGPTLMFVHHQNHYTVTGLPESFSRIWITTFWLWICLCTSYSMINTVVWHIKIASTPVSCLSHVDRFSCYLPKHLSSPHFFSCETWDNSSWNKAEMAGKFDSQRADLCVNLGLKRSNLQLPLSRSNQKRWNRRAKLQMCDSGLESISCCICVYIVYIVDPRVKQFVIDG